MYVVYKLNTKSLVLSSNIVINTTVTVKGIRHFNANRVDDLVYSGRK